VGQREEAGPGVRADRAVGGARGSGGPSGPPAGPAGPNPERGATTGRGDRAEDGAVDSGPDVAGLQRRLVRFAEVRGWGPYHTPKNLATALGVEAAELAEIFQWLTPEQSARVMSDEETARRVRDEVADVLAYLLQFCAVLGVDPLDALSAKIDRNETRFPAP
jgi:NTP pyrophosphatase (non-canonical NTP hydrolase)